MPHTTVRFWGTVRTVRARLTLAKFESETYPTSDGNYLVVSGTVTAPNAAPVPRDVVVAVGPGTQEEKHLAQGDLVRGDAVPVPETSRDCFAELYRVRVLHVVARGQALGGDPPRTDPALSVQAAVAAPRRVLEPAYLSAGGACEYCPYGTEVAVVRLSDPRDLKRGIWSRVTACLGPADCPHYRSSTR